MAKRTEKVTIKRGVGAPRRDRWPFADIKTKDDVLEITGTDASPSAVRSAASRAGKQLGRSFSVTVDRDDSGEVTKISVFLTK